MLPLCDAHGHCTRVAPPSYVLLTPMAGFRLLEPFQSVRDTGSFSILFSPIIRQRQFPWPVTGCVSRRSEAKNSRTNHAPVQDEIPIRTGHGVVRRFLHQHRMIVVEEFPPYAPELNPVDYVWSYVEIFTPSQLCPKRPRYTPPSDYNRISPASKAARPAEIVFQPHGTVTDARRIFRKFRARLAWTNFGRAKSIPPLQ